MRRIKLLCIAPYEGLCEAIKMVAERYRQVLEVDAQVGNLNQSLVIAEEARLRDYDAIISRGGTSELLQGYVDLPVINIEVSGYDFMRAIMLARNITGKKAFVGFPYITKKAKSINDLLGSDIEIFTTQTQSEVEPLLHRLNAAGYGLVVGDVAACRIAAEMAMKDMLLTSGDESIADAFDKAILAVGLVRRWKGEYLHMRNIVGSDDHAIVAFDKNARVIYNNEMYSRLGISQNELAGIAGNFSELKEQYMMVRHRDRILKISVRTFCAEDEEPYTVFYISNFSENDAEAFNGVSVSNFKMQAGNVADLFKQYNVYDADAAVTAASLVRSRQPLLIRGDVGVGKVDLAASIHRCSDFWSEPFVDINCRVADPVAALDELHFKRDQAMRLNRGTICFEAIDALDLNVQHHLMSMLHRLNSADWRFIATGNEDMAAKVAAGSLTRELYEFFAGLCLSVPGFGQNGEGIREAVSLSIIEANTQLGRQVIGITEQGMEVMLAHRWKRNLRELRNSVNQMVMLAKGSYIGADEVRTVLKMRSPTKANGENSAPADLHGSLDDIELRIIRAVLEEEGDNYTKTAARLGISRSTLWRKLRGGEEV